MGQLSRGHTVVNKLNAKKERVVLLGLCWERRPDRRTRVIQQQVYRYNPKAYASRCPSCDCHEEDFKHAFCCPARHSWQSNLRRDLLKLFDSSHTNQVLQDLLLNGLHHWFRDTPQPPASPGERYNTLVESQSSIGWNQLIFGR